MFMKIPRWCLLLLSLLFVFTLPVSAAVEMLEENDTYVFAADMHTLDAPTAYTVTEILYAEDLGESSPINPDDLAVGYDGSIYIADSVAGKIYKISADRQTVSCLQTFQMGETTERLQAPTGVFARRDGTVFVADGGTRKVYVFDENFQYQRYIAPPTKEELITDHEYVPVKVCADRGDRVYVIAKDQTQGILQFSPTGKVSGYLCATRVVPSLGDLIMRRFATKEQLKTLLRFVPTEYNNMAVNENDFIYATIGSLDEWSIYSDVRTKGTSATPIRLLNPKGVDSLVRSGNFPPSGDVNFIPSNGSAKNTKDVLLGASRIVDTAYRKNGVYCLLDYRRGRVYTYDGNGALLFMFGNSGAKKDELITPTAIDYWGDSLVVSDLAMGCIKVFSPTEYAEKIFSAIDYHEDGDFEKEYEIWDEVRREYIGSELAYNSLGKSAMESKDYEGAMQYFRLAGNKTNYSKAYEAFRKEWGYENIIWLFGGLIIVCLLVYAVVYFVRKKVPVHEGNPETLVQRVVYSKYVLAHPFKGFYDLKKERIGTLASASAILVSIVVLKLLQVALSPYLLQSGSGLFQGAYGILLLVGLFVVANWCLTTLMDGKGTIRDIYIFTCYSLFPILLFLPFQILLGQIVSLDEIILYEFLGTVAVVLTGLLIFIGTIVTHEYSAVKAAGMLILTVVGMMILVFIAMLCFTLAQQIIKFAGNIITEIRLR